jgi:Spy/CpxP family protein refolding chaperone
MRKTITLGFILASALAIAGTAFAAGGDHDGGRHFGGHGPRGHHGMHEAFAKLNLTDAQKASIKQIFETSRGQNKDQWKALRTQREAFEQMTPDQVGYQAAAARLAQAEGQATQARVEQRAKVQAQIYAVLTPAQKAQLATMRAQREARREQWKEFRQSHPAPSASTAQ